MRQYASAQKRRHQFLPKLTVTVEEAAIALGIGRGLAYELAANGSLPAVRLGRRLVIPWARLEAMLDGDPR